MSNNIRATVLGGLAAGSLDHLAALASLVPHGVSATHIHQYLASAVVGPATAFAGGWATALLGLCVQLTLTTVMAGTFVVASHRFPILLRQPWYSGVTYGVLIYFVMNYVAVPLSAATNWTPPAGWALVGSLLSHCSYVGLPIAIIARAVLTDSPSAVPTLSVRSQLSELHRNRA